MERTQEGNDRRNTEAADKAAAEKKIAEAEAKLAREEVERKAEQARADQAAATAAIDVPVVSAEAIEPLSTEAAAELSPTYTASSWDVANTRGWPKNGNGQPTCPTVWDSKWSKSKDPAIATVVVFCQDGVVKGAPCRLSDGGHDRPKIISDGDNIKFDNYPGPRPISAEIQCKTQEEGVFQLFIRGEHVPNK